jgi:hypothetical protein
MTGLALNAMRERGLVLVEPRRRDVPCSHNLPSN